MVCPHSMCAYYASAGVRTGALPHEVTANMGHSLFAMTAQHYTQSQSLSAEQLLAKLPSAMLRRIAEPIARQTAVRPTGLPKGG